MQNTTKNERLTKAGGLDFADKNLSLANEWGYSHIYNRLAKLEDMLDDGELVSKDWHDEQVFHYVDENAELREEIKTLKAELKKELAEHEEFTKKAKAEIERLTEENEHLDMVAKQALADYQNAQVQVDELKANQVIECHGILKGCDMVKQAVKDTAKDVLQRIMNIIKKSDCFLSEEVIRIMAKQKGVEVE